MLRMLREETQVLSRPEDPCICDSCYTWIAEQEAEEHELMAQHLRRSITNRKLRR